MLANRIHERVPGGRLVRWGERQPEINVAARPMRSFSVGAEQVNPLDFGQRLANRGHDARSSLVNGSTILRPFDSRPQAYGMLI